MTLKDMVLYCVLVLSWSASWYALSLQVGDVAVSTSLFWRFAIAATIMWIWVALMKGPVRFSRSRHAAFAGLGFFIFFLNFTLFYYGSAYLISGLLSVVFSLASVFNLILGLLLFRRVPPLAVVLGATLGFAGIALMFWPEIANQNWTGTGVTGLVLCVAGTLSFCTGSQISAWLQARSVSVISASAWGMAYGTTFSGLLTLVTGESFAIPMDLIYVGSLVFLAVVSSVIAFWSYLTLVGRIGAGRAGYATVMFPVLALGISAVMEGYSFPAIAVAGLVLVLAGNVLVLRNAST